MGFTLISRWEPRIRRHADRLVLEFPAQTHGKLLVFAILWLLFWPLGALVLPTYYAPWIESRPVFLGVTLLLAGLWMLPWLYTLWLLYYLFSGSEKVSIRAGSVEIERGARPFLKRHRYDGVEPASWRVSPARNHIRDWQGIMSGGRPGPLCEGGALTFTYNRRAVRCGRNLGTRKARVLLRTIQEFLEEDER